MAIQSCVSKRFLLSRVRRRTARNTAPTRISTAFHSNMAAPANTEPQIPRPSASLIIVNARNEVLMVQRNPEARHFAGVTVFPGGNLDKKQDDSMEQCAIRETFEESGLLHATSQSKSLRVLSDQVLDEARANIHAQQLNFKAFLGKHQLVADTKSLLPFTQWITPTNAPRRFHAHFFVTFLSRAPSTGFTSGAKQERIPKPDGGQEVISARFIHPADALAEFRSKKITFMPPQAYLLTTLAEILQGRQNTLAQREYIMALSNSLFGTMVINPRRLQAEDEEGRTILTYEGDETRGGSKGRLHRVLVKVGKGGITSEVVLQRNFNILTEIEPHVFTGPTVLSAKL